MIQHVSAGPVPPMPSVNRKFSVFIGYTFLDTQPERDYLVKYVFPELCQICRERDVSFTAFGLSSGIPERLARNPGIVSITLDEIHRLRPFIICIVGECYGWQTGLEDHRGDRSVLELYPWVGQGLGERRSSMEHRSSFEPVTVECTMHDRTMNARLRFYFRSSTSGSTFRTDKHWSVDALKTRIRSSRMLVREPYGDIEILGAWVREDLLAEIDRLFPLHQNASYIEQERRGHEAFAASKRRLYVENTLTLHRLDRHAEHDDRGWGMTCRVFPLVVTGRSGSGKSSLLSYWCARYRQEHPDAFIVEHYVGATSTSTGHLELMRRVMLEIHDRFGIIDTVPEDPEMIAKEFPYWLRYASGCGMVLLIDALNQLNESSRRSLRWLPDYFPSYVRVIVSTLEGEILNELRHRNWQVLTVQPLTKQERTTMVKSYLNIFGRAPDSANVRQLVVGTTALSPLVPDEEVSTGISELLEARDLNELYQLYFP